MRLRLRPSGDSRTRSTTSRPPETSGRRGSPQRTSTVVAARPLPLVRPKPRSGLVTECGTVGFSAASLAIPTPRQTLTPTSIYRMPQHFLRDEHPEFRDWPRARGLRTGPACASLYARTPSLQRSPLQRAPLMPRSYRIPRPSPSPSTPRPATSWSASTAIMGLPAPRSLA